jgi:hypothetical protein
MLVSRPVAKQETCQPGALQPGIGDEPRFGDDRPCCVLPAGARRPSRPDRCERNTTPLVEERLRTGLEAAAGELVRDVLRLHFQVEQSAGSDRIGGSATALDGVARGERRRARALTRAFPPDPGPPPSADDAGRARPHLTMPEPERSSPAHRCDNAHCLAQLCCRPHARGDRLPATPVSRSVQQAGDCAGANLSPRGGPKKCLVRGFAAANGAPTSNGGTPW